MLDFCPFWVSFYLLQVSGAHGVAPHQNGHPWKEGGHLHTLDRITTSTAGTQSGRAALPPFLYPVSDHRPPMEGGRTPSHPRPDHHHRRPRFPPWVTMGGGHPPELHTLTTCRQSEQIRRPFRPRMCADVLVYVGAYVRICAGRGAGAYTHGRAHPRGRTHDLSVAAGLGFVYGMFIFIGTVFCRKLPL